MFKKVLVANRGEIAVRILRACEERGLRTVAVYSDADRTALHVRYADEAYRIGPPSPKESYLNIPAIIAAARQAGVDAVHPGYGFLSENADFAQAVLDAGLAWVGPAAEAIRAMGDKVTARQLMIAAGVPVVPGADAGLSDTEAVGVAQEIGYPVLIKASAGGGGKGMRQVNDPADLPRALAAARREAAGAFGDDTIYLEKVITGARHVELQVLADQYGNCIHLGERECSIQRRHQKLIEEAPSVAVPPELRAEMGAIAVRAAQAVGYSNAGTVEFLLDRSGHFYFLEMNTRLQVEHPITEQVTGIDLVKEQLAIASGRKLRWTQADIQIKGHAIECRISSEDPYNSFLPAAGRITSLSEPTGPGVRLESGICAGFEVSLFYDPLLAKLVVWGENRAEAILRMRRALDEYRIGGIHTTIPFHQQVMDSTRFQGGQFDTSFVDGPDGFRLSAAPSQNLTQVAAIAAALAEHERAQLAVILGSPCDEQGLRISPWKQAGRVGGVRSR
ncbi:MAG: acetyl-CoA carboxylase biotin carboxylase subunit [Chloroflexi bacterium HGW-Chloroflexi-1]|nr:MAG: acetyl-CoA carboxylase biotin carboxylase subunit [Chloroflexi bacterium HGW-Chloroflexi-1]